LPRHLDYGVQFNGLMYQRFIEDGDITLFSPHEVPGLYEVFSFVITLFILSVVFVYHF
jgi:hypothetical protein